MLFFDNDVKKYQKKLKYISSISDIRHLDIRQAVRKNNRSHNKSHKLSHEQEDQLDKIVDDDMKKQLHWIQIIKPNYASLKLRFP